MRFAGRPRCAASRRSDARRSGRCRGDCAPASPSRARRARDAGGRQHQSGVALGRSGEKCGTRPVARQELRVVPWRARTSMRGVAARYPRTMPAHGDRARPRGRIEAMPTWRRQQAGSAAAKSEDLLALTAYVAYQSRGLPVAVSIDGPARAAFERGARSTGAPRADESRVHAMPRPELGQAPAEPRR